MASEGKSLSRDMAGEKGTSEKPKNWRYMTASYSDEKIGIGIERIAEFDGEFRVEMLVQSVENLHGLVVLVESEPDRIVDGEPQFNRLADIAGGNLEKDVVDADGRIVVDLPEDDVEEGVAEFFFADGSLLDVSQPRHVAIVRGLASGGMDFVGVMVMKPASEGGVEFIEGERLIFCLKVDVRNETIANSAEKTLYLSAGRRVMRLGMNEDETETRGQQGKMRFGKNLAVVRVETVRDTEE